MSLEVSATEVSKADTKNEDEMKDLVSLGAYFTGQNKYKIDLSNMATQINYLHSIGLITDMEKRRIMDQVA